MDDLFRLTKQDLFLLSPERGVELIQDLLWAEAGKYHIPRTKIDISQNIFIPDEGLDATVSYDAIEKDDIIKRGKTGYQIKTGKNFNPNKDSEIRKELFGIRKKIKKDNLKKGIKELLDNNGAYIVICFGLDLTSQERNNAENKIRTSLKLCGYLPKIVEVWSQNNLISFLSVYPTISQKYKSIAPYLFFQNHKSWATNEDMRLTFIQSIKQNNIIDSIKSCVKSDEAIHIRVLGEAGIGKTRLVLESLKENGIKEIVAYHDSPEQLRNKPLMNLLRNEDSLFRIILVVDECNFSESTYFWSTLKNCKLKIKLITIYNEFDTSIGGTQIFYLDNLTDNEITEIIKSYDIPTDIAEKWAELCGGSPRVAHVVGKGIKINCNNLLNNPDICDMWKRYICGSDRSDSIDVLQRITVLQYISLFKKFGIDRSIKDEALAISKLIQDNNPLITKDRFFQIVHLLQNRRILQGESTLYITPKLLHIKLWTDWWDNFGAGFDFEMFSKDMPLALLDWFNEMFKYAAESNIAKKIVKELLSIHGPFRDNNFMFTDSGSRFFLALSEADPHSAISSLSIIINKLSNSDLKRFVSGRRNIVWALQKIIIWRDLFFDGAKILLRLALAENEKYSNNATGIFISLFSLSAPTELSPLERFLLLEEIIDSQDIEIRKIALASFNATIAKYPYRGFIYATYHGLNKKPDIWTPKTENEINDYYKLVWNKLFSKIEHDGFEDAVNILLNNARTLLIYPPLSEMVLESLKMLSTNNANKEELLKEISRILHFDYKRLPVEITKELEKIKNNISGNDYSSMMKRYVGMNLFEDTYDRDGNRNNITNDIINELAQKSLLNKADFQKELDWLVTEKAKNAYILGYSICKIDTSLSLLETILSAMLTSEEKVETALIGGYFCALFEQNINEWESQIEKLSKQVICKDFVVDIMLRSGLSEKTILIAMKLSIEAPYLVKSFESFAYGGRINNISAKTVNKLCTHILNSNLPEAGAIAATILNYYYLRDEKKDLLPEKLTYTTLIHDTFFKFYPLPMHDSMYDHYYTQLGKEFIAKHAEYGLLIADKIFSNYGVQGSIFSDFFSQAQEVVNLILENDPISIWEIITKYLEPEFNERAFAINNWLRGGEFYSYPEGAIELIPIQEILKWVNEDIGIRAPYLAKFVPPVLKKNNSDVCLAKELLIHYGKIKEVRINLISNFITEGWTGSASLHYKAKKAELVDMKNNEINQNIIKWMTEYIAWLDQIIETSTIEEERRGY